ncbi:hypothetical protein JTB14_010005 [Gonioctena quinquepunctata]|nr:hypothetical protein JTB14_010005 [Gonioctena quinquepunctata]
MILKLPIHPCGGVSDLPPPMFACLISREIKHPISYPRSRLNPNTSSAINAIQRLPRQRIGGDRSWTASEEQGGCYKKSVTRGHLLIGSPTCYIIENLNQNISMADAHGLRNS